MLKRTLHSILIENRTLFKNKEYEFGFPVDNPEIKKKFSENNIKTINQFFRFHRHNNIDDFFTSFERQLLRNKGMNPGKEFFSKNFFVSNSIIEEISESINNIKTGLNRVIVHEGNRGSGKTITQNIFLHDHFNEEKEKTFWVRCDAHKLYRIWNKNKINRSTLSIEDYLYLQLSYVFCKYYNRRNFFKKIFEEIRKEEVTVYLPKPKDASSHFPKDPVDLKKNFEVDDLSVVIESNNQKIISRERNEDDDYSYMFDLIVPDAIKSNFPRAKKQWLATSHAIKKFLFEKGCYILFIVDGIDNIDLTNSNKEKYEEIKLDLSHFLKSNKHNQLLRIVSLRTRTLSEIMKIQAESEETFGFIKSDENIHINHIKPIKDDFPNFTDILSERVNWWFNERDQDWSFNTNIIESIFRGIIDFDSEREDICNEFHHNIRNYLANRLNLCKYIFFRYIVRNEPKDFNIQKEINVACLENNFLNGNLFLETKRLATPEMSSDKGFYAVNPFYISEDMTRFENKLKLKNWQGLCFIRIIQFLSEKNRNVIKIKQSDIEDKLSYSFNYDKDFIRLNIDFLRAYQIIDSELYINEIIDDSIIEIKLSQKGKKYLSLVFSSVEILYLLSLDTYLPKFLFESGKFIDSSLRDHQSHAFSKNLIKSTISFISFLKHVETVEKKRFLKKDGNNKDGYNKTFKIPFEDSDSYVNQMDKYLDFIHSEESKSEIRELFKEFI